jgi:hypothetical protein
MLDGVVHIYVMHTLNMVMDQELTTLTKEHHILQGGQTQWVKLKLETQSVLLVTAAHVSFYRNQNWSIRMWFSLTPRGQSVTREPVVSRAFVSPLKTPVRFGLYDHVVSQVPDLPHVIWLQPASAEITYYLNILNMENKPNEFFLRVDTEYP